MARELVVFCGNKEGFENGLSQNRMCFVVMRKNMRLGGRDAVYFVVMRKNMRLGGREPDVLCGDEKEYEIGWPRTGGT